MFEPAAAAPPFSPYSGAAPIFELLAAGKIGFKIESWEVKAGERKWNDQRGNEEKKYGQIHIKKWDKYILIFGEGW